MFNMTKDPYNVKESSKTDRKVYVEKENDKDPYEVSLSYIVNMGKK